MKTVRRSLHDNNTMTEPKRIENQAACPEPILFASQHLEDGLWYSLLKYVVVNLHSLQNQTQSKFDNMMENMMSICDQTCDIGWKC